MVNAIYDITSPVHYFKLNDLKYWYSDGCTLHRMQTEANEFIKTFLAQNRINRDGKYNIS